MYWTENENLRIHYLNYIDLYVTMQPVTTQPVAPDQSRHRLWISAANQLKICPDKVPQITY